MLKNLFAPDAADGAAGAVVDLSTVLERRFSGSAAPGAEEVCAKSQHAEVLRKLAEKQAAAGEAPDASAPPLPWPGRRSDAWAWRVPGPGRPGRRY